ncbi:N-acetyltransferase [Chitinophaga silvatica]|uniref:N-acetyltransferase n=1 Tax=Chitinophaga silvatica TaxID=2282649 RepID=A0A3E1YE31_9BACT|nr:GNAT family N-acetyltransferase [Chitinophaga silvatica]RFS24744.1 N-acetyltransferase [Chitinophaga silvatica]
MIYLETPRLRIRDWEKRDIPPLVAMNGDSRVMEYFPHPYTEAETMDQYNRINEEFIDFGYGLYVLERKEDNAFLGFTGFHNFNFLADFSPGVEIAWRIKFEEWNKGYVTEAAKGCLEYAKKNLFFKEVFSFTAIQNKRSERVMQKIGMEKIKEFDHPNVPENHWLKQHVLYKTLL